MAVEKNIKINVDAKNAIRDVQALDKGVKDTSRSAAGTKGAFGKMTGAVKGLGVAFKALGIGLIVAALMKLKDIFSGNIETARKFEVITSQLSAAFDVIRDRAEDFINALIRLKNPLQAFKEAFTGTTAEIKEETQAMADLTRQLQAVRDSEMEMVVVRAEANRIIAESRLLAEDETKSLEDRLVALKAAIAEEQRVAEIELDIQQRKVDALQAVIDLGKSSEEDLQNLANERARLIDLQTSSTQRQLRVTRELNTMERELLADAKKKGDQEKAITMEQIDSQTALQNSIKKTGIIRVQTAQQTADAEIQIERYKNNTVRGIVSSAMGDIASLVGEESKAGKALAVGQALINTYSAATAALAPPPVGAGPIFGPIAAIGAVAAGMANVKKIIATKLPGVTGGGDDGPSPDVPSPQAMMGMGGLTPNLEAISPPDIGTQPVQAYVVETDISDAQALQEELEIQATL